VRLYLAGGEVPSHRKLLNEGQAPQIAVSFLGLARRVKFSRPWLLADKFHAEAKLFVDSGAYTVNRESADEDKYSQRELKDKAAAYRDFVALNFDRLEFVSEFDALPLGRDWIEDQRESWTQEFGWDKFLAIWHPDWGIETLQEMCATYSRVGVPQTALGGRNLVPLLNAQVAQFGVRLHGVAMTKVEEMQTVQWHSVASTSWISPQRYGDTIVWANNELKRYPKAYKDQARKRHRVLFDKIGLDSQKIEDGDSTEALRLSMWSWRQLEDHINRHRNTPDESRIGLFQSLTPEQRDAMSHAEIPNWINSVTTPGNQDTDPFDASGLPVVDSPGPETAHRALTPASRDKVPIPVMGVGTRRARVLQDDGTEQDEDVPVIGIRSESTRVCDSCFLASKCPQFEPGSDCAFDIPIQIKTRDQFKALQDALIEMQVQRVMFMRFAEEAEGGYADPNLSGEIDRLNKMIRQKHEIDEGVFSLRMDVKGSGGGPGMLARMFGEEASERARALPEPVSADRAIEQYWPDKEAVDR
jgi:hypothetical protein